MATETDRSIDVQRGAVLPVPMGNLGIIKCTGLTFENGASANDRDTAFTIKSQLVVLGCWINVTTKATNSVTASIGLGASGAGSATDFSGELAVNATAAVASAATAMCVKAGTDATIVAEISGDPGATAPVFDLYLIVADATL